MLAKLVVFWFLFCFCFDLSHPNGNGVFWFLMDWERVGMEGKRVKRQKGSNTRHKNGLTSTGCPDVTETFLELSGHLESNWKGKQHHLMGQRLPWRLGTPDFCTQGPTNAGLGESLYSAIYLFYLLCEEDNRI